MKTAAAKHERATGGQQTAGTRAQWKKSESCATISRVEVPAKEAACPNETIATGYIRLPGQEQHRPFQGMDAIERI